MSRRIHTGVISLPQAFVDGDRGCVGQIQTADIAEHGDTDAVFFMCLQKFFGETRRFFAEHEKIPFPILYVAVDVPTLGGKEEKATLREFREEFLYIFVIIDIYVFPVIETGAFEVFIGHLEAERLYEVQIAAGRRASSDDVARILGDFRLYQYDIKHILYSPFFH